MLLSLLASPVLGPVKLLRGLSQAVLDQAETALYDEPSIRGEMAALEAAFDAGEISEEELEERESVLLDRLREARRLRTARAAE